MKRTISHYEILEYDLEIGAESRMPCVIGLVHLIGDSSQMSSLSAKKLWEA